MNKSIKRLGEIAITKRGMDRETALALMANADRLQATVKNLAGFAQGRGFSYKYNGKTDGGTAEWAVRVDGCKYIYMAHAGTSPYDKMSAEVRGTCAWMVAEALMEERGANGEK